jgi:hypothetical protein
MAGQSSQLSLSEACKMQDRVQHPSSQAVYGKGKKGGAGGKAITQSMHGAAGSKESHQGK